MYTYPRRWRGYVYIIFIIGNDKLKKIFIRILNMLLGLVLYAFGITLTLKANIGYSPWEVFHVGLADTIRLSFGITTIIVGIVIIIIVTALGEQLGWGTFASMIITGMLVDVFLALDIIPLLNNTVIGIVMLLAGMFIIAIGSYFYMKSAFGVGPRDNLMVVLTRRTKIPVGICRIIVEVSITFVGWLMGGMVGIGTIISGFAIGAFVQIVFKTLKFDVTAIKHETIKETLKQLKTGQ